MPLEIAANQCIFTDIKARVQGWWGTRSALSADVRMSRRAIVSFIYRIQDSKGYRFRWHTRDDIRPDENKEMYKYRSNVCLTLVIWHSYRRCPVFRTQMGEIVSAKTDCGLTKFIKTRFPIKYKRRVVALNKFHRLWTGVIANVMLTCCEWWRDKDTISSSSAVKCGIPCARILEPCYIWKRKPRFCNYQPYEQPRSSIR